MSMGKYVCLKTKGSFEIVSILPSHTAFNSIELKLFKLLDNKLLFP